MLVEQSAPENVHGPSPSRPNTSCVLLIAEKDWMDARDWLRKPITGSSLSVKVWAASW